MKIAVLGTGMVGQALAAGLAAKGHDVTVGTRDVQKSIANTAPNGFGMPGFGTWHKENKSIKVQSFKDAAAAAEMIFNASNGSASLDVLKLAEAETLGGKILIDVTNDLDFSKGMPPKTNVSDVAGSSLGERIQKAFPNLKVVKSLNTMNAFVMLNPAAVAGGDSTVFISGDDKAAKTKVHDLLTSFGWKDIMDLGGIATSRAVEMMMPIWLTTFGVLGQPMYNFKIMR
jgi:8-hydroxy-5-deazaflavin:NADPH oxidoreductase